MITCVDIFIEATEGGGLLAGYDAGPIEGDLGRGTAEEDRDLISTDAEADDVSIFDYGTFSAISGSGFVLTGNVGVYVKHGSPPEGNGPFGAGNQCIFRYEQEKVAQVGS